MGRPWAPVESTRDFSKLRSFILTRATRHAQQVGARYLQEVSQHGAVFVATSASHDRTQACATRPRPAPLWDEACGSRAVNAA